MRSFAKIKPTRKFSNLQYLLHTHAVRHQLNICFNRKILPQFENQTSCMKGVVLLWKNCILLAGTGVRNIRTVACGFSPIKIHYSDQNKWSLCVCFFSIKYRSLTSFIAMFIAFSVTPGVTHSVPTAFITWWVTIPYPQHLSRDEWPIRTHCIYHVMNDHSVPTAFITW